MAGDNTPEPEPYRDSLDKIDKDDKKEETVQHLLTAIVRPPLQLPQPEAPPGLMTSPTSLSGELTERRRPIERSVSAASKFFRDRGAAIAKRISSLKDSGGSPLPDVTEFNIEGLKVTVRMKGDAAGDGEIRGRITFFSRSGCRDSGAVRSFLRDRRLPYVEINVDVFPERESELTALTGSGDVPAIFFNESLIGGLVALNSLRNSGEFDRRLWEMAGRRCPETVPAAPVYGFDDDESRATNKPSYIVSVVNFLRHRLPIQDRIGRMKLVKNCFSGADMVEGIIQHVECGRKKAVEIGKELARKHFIHHVYRENDFEDSKNQFYRFLEHDPTIPKCYNFRGSTNDNEPKSVLAIGLRINKLMVAILEAYASDDRCHLDYARVSASEEFRRYVNVVHDLQRVDLFSLSVDEKMSFFLNLYNAMVIHAVIMVGQPRVIDRNAFYSDFQYIIGGYPYSLSAILNGILRCNQRQPYSFIKPFSSGDKRLELIVKEVTPLIHFGLCNGTKSSPTVRFFSPQGVDMELRYAAREFFLNDGVEVDLEKRTIYLTRIIKWYSADFGQDKDILKWILNYLDATKAGLLTHLLNDGGQIHISYKIFDWSLNC